MERKKGSKLPNGYERSLFHGTNSKYIEPICQQGFDFRVSGKSVGTVFGKGAYFARDAKYSSCYTESNCLFVVKVLVGDYTVGRRQYTRPPEKDPSNPNQNFFDSCVNDVKDPSIFVVFENDHTYPEYLIVYS